MDITAYLKQKKKSIDRRLDELLPPESEFPPIIHQAMRYSVFAGGKRLRPILAITACQAVGGEEMFALDAGCALELIHTYSLIHDDLPALDNDDLRRGKPASHKVFGDGIAILAGDALLTMGFKLLSQSLIIRPPYKQGLQIIIEVAEAVGSKGMIGGQVMDLQSEGKKVDLKTISYIHKSKAAALITISAKLGGMLGNASEDKLKMLTEYGRKVGLAFQIIDDILDVEGSDEKLGKIVGKDIESLKATYPGVIGMAQSKKIASELIKEAIDELKPLGNPALPLAEVARFILIRQS